MNTVLTIFPLIILSPNRDCTWNLLSSTWMTGVTNFFLPFLFLMRNSIQEIIWLILFQIDFLSICVLQILRNTLKTLMILHSECCRIPPLPLLYPMLVSRITSLHQYCTFIHMINLSSRRFIKWSNITTTEAKLFAIWCGINQVASIANINHIVVIMDSLHAAKRIFDSSLHPYQIQSAAISHELRDFFLKDINNCIEFWDCPSKQKWPLHALVDKDSKSSDSIPIFPCKSSWDFCKKQECDSILSQWEMSFQVADLKGKNFLELLDNNLYPIELSTTKGGPWLIHFGLSNSLCARASRAIVNHAPISEYHLKFFPREDFSCPCSLYPVETRQHILHECKRFNRYWNSRRDTIAHFALFLQFNPSAFSFV